MYARDYRDLARRNLTGKWGMAAVATFIVSLLGGVSVGGFFLQPYMYTADAVFYRELTAGVNIHDWLY